MEHEQAQEAAPTPETTQVQPEEARAEKPTLSELLAAMDAPREEAQVETQEQQVTEEVATEAVETEEVATEQVETETEEEEQPEELKEEPKKSKSFRGKWDHLDEQERRVVELTTKRGLSLKEAQRAVYGDSLKAEETQAQAAVDPVAEIDTRISETQAEIDRIEAEIEEKEFESDFDAKAARRKLREAEGSLYELKADRKIQLSRQEESHRQSAEREQSTFQTRFEASVASAQEAYPEAFADDSEFAAAVSEEIEYLRSTNAPILKNPNYPETVVARIARQLGYAKAATPSPANKPQPTPVATKPPVKPNRGIRPVPAGGLPVATEAQTLEQQMAAAKRDPNALLGLLRDHGTPLEELTKK